MFKLTSDNICQPCIQNCSDCVDGQSCKTCQIGFYFDSIQKLCIKCSDNCNQCNSSTICDVCSPKFLKQGVKCVACEEQPEYQLDQNNNCIECNISQCDKCSSSNQCQKCKDGYVINDQKNCQYHQCDENCFACVNSICEICYDGYYLDQTSKLCLKCDSNCSTCEKDAKTCLTCESGYYLDQKSQQCVQCQNNCTQCESSQSCSQCKPTFALKNSQCVECASQQGYFLDPNTNNCVQCDPFCQTCQSSILCKDCIKAYILNLENNKCEKQTKQCGLNCLTCNQQSQCQKCKDNFYLDSQYNCQQCDKSCLTCLSDQICSSCQQGYFLDQNSKCQQCNNNCLLCTNKNQCTKCSQGYLLQDANCLDCSTLQGYFQDQNQGCVQCDPNCDLCESSTQCKTCQQGFEKQNQKCQKICSQNCKTCNSGQCSECLDGFFLDDKQQCEKCDINCLSCTNVETCTKCQKEFLLNNNKCLNCSTYPGYIQDSNQNCVQCDPNCNQCKSSTQCDVCKEGFNLQDGKCLQDCIQNCQQCKNGDCSQCKDGFFLYRTNECKQCDSNCQICSDAITCSKCNQGFLLKENKCVDCSSLQGYFKDSNNQCQQCDSNCDKCSSPIECSLCLNGFDLKSGKCQAQCSQNCDKCDQKKCNQCTKRFFLDDNLKCQKCETNCLECNNLQKCTQCDKGFLIKENKCVDCSTQSGYIRDPQKNCIQCDPNCDKCESSTQCQVCQNGFSLQNGKCQISCIQNCKNCNEGQCNECIDGFYLDKSECKKCDMNCLQCLIQKNCQKCVEGFKLNSENICIPCDSNYYYDKPTKQCIKCSKDMIDNNQCEVCPIGFYMNQKDNSCHKCHENCRTCQGSKYNQCNSCSEGSVLHKNTCYSCEEGFYFEKEDLSCKKCTPPCNKCQGNKGQECLSCSQNYFLDKSIKNCKAILDNDDVCGNIQVFDEDLLDQCFENQPFVKQTSTILQFLTFSTLFLSLLMTCLQPLYGSVFWFYLQTQQLIGNYIFSRHLNVLWINQYHLKFTYMHNILNIIPNFLNENAQVIYNFNLLDTLINVQNYSTDFFANCFYQIILLVIASLLSILVFFRKNMLFQKRLFLLKYINWNYLIVLLRIGSNFLLISISMTIGMNSTVSAKDGILFFFIVFIYSAFNYHMAQKLFRIQPIMENQDSYLYSLMIDYISKQTFITRAFWIIFELNKCIIIFIQGTILPSDKYTSAPWLHFSITLALLVYLIFKKPIINQLCNNLIIIIQIFHVLIVFVISNIIVLNDKPLNQYLPFKQNNKDSIKIFGYALIVLMLLLAFTQLISCIFIISCYILSKIKKRKEQRSNLSALEFLSIQKKSNHQSLTNIIQGVRSNEIKWKLNPINQQKLLKISTQNKLSNSYNNQNSILPD